VLVGSIFVCKINKKPLRITRKRVII